MKDGYSILIIGDSDNDQETYRRLLRDTGAIREIRTAKTPSEGLAAFETMQADCVLVDCASPNHDGLRVLDNLRSIDCRSIPIIIIKARGNEDIAVEAIKRGASDYLVKETVSPIRLRRTIDNALENACLRRSMDRQREEQDLFLRTLIHDAKAPLRHISTFAALLEEDILEKNYDDIQQHGRAIRTSARRIQDLIDTLAAYALQEGDVDFTSVSMNSVVEAALDNLAQVIDGRGAKVTVDPLPDVTGHAPQLVQVLQNLISNSVKYCQAESPEVHIAAQPDNKGSWRFQVEDNGIGIPEDQWAGIFEPFKRLWCQDHYEGTGLGLAICKKIVERHGGRIWCYSTPGKGSSFTFTLRQAEATGA